MIHKNTKTRVHIAIVALFCCGLFITAPLILPMPTVITKLLFDLGEGSIFPYPFTIQNLMWCMFFIGLGELYFRMLYVKNMQRALINNYLPTDAHIVLTNGEMGEVYRSVKFSTNPLSELIKSLALRFQASNSVEQTHSMFNSQMEMWQYRLEVDYNMLRYLCWLIPTLGFIGTMVGISQALSYAGSGNIDPTAAEFLPTITRRLGVAFDTTLMALVMSAILVFCMHLIQGREERIIVQSGQYCLDHLINRLYDGKNLK